MLPHSNSLRHLSRYLGGSRSLVEERPNADPGIPLMTLAEAQNRIAETIETNVEWLIVQGITRLTGKLTRRSVFCPTFSSAKSLATPSTMEWRDREVS